MFVIITKIRVSSAIIYFSPPERREISKPSQSRHRGPVLHLGKGEVDYEMEREGTRGGRGSTVLRWG